MISENRRLANLSGIARYVAYLLNPGLMKQGDRVAESEILYADVFFTGDNHQVYGEKFARDLDDWTVSVRGSRKPPKEIAYDSILSFHPEDRKKINALKALQIANEVIAAVAPGDRFKVSVVHNDTDHLHVHTVFSTVDATGKVFNQHKDWAIWEKACTEAEKRYGLKPVGVGRNKDQIAPWASEVQSFGRTGKLSDKTILQRAVKDARDRSANLEQLIENLSTMSVRVRVEKHCDGSPKAIFFSRAGGAELSGSALGSTFTLGKLSKAMSGKVALPEYKFQLMSKVSSALNKARSMAEFLQLVDKKNVQVITRKDKRGAAIGVAFAMNGKAFVAGGELDRSLKLSSIKKRLRYDVRRDAQVLRRCSPDANTTLEQAGSIACGCGSRAPMSADRRTTLYRTFDALPGGEYRWKGINRVAFIDKGSRISFMSRNLKAIKAGLLLAKEKGWEVVVIQGGEQFRREAWVQAQLMGIQCVGYIPSAEDIKYVEQNKESSNGQATRPQKRCIAAARDELGRQESTAENRSAQVGRANDGKADSAPREVDRRCIGGENTSSDYGQTTRTPQVNGEIDRRPRAADQGSESSAEPAVSNDHGPKGLDGPKRERDKAARKTDQVPSRLYREFRRLSEPWTLREKRSSTNRPSGNENEKAEAAVKVEDWLATSSFTR